MQQQQQHSYFTRSLKDVEEVPAILKIMSYKPSMHTLPTNSLVTMLRGSMREER